MAQGIAWANQLLLYKFLDGARMPRLIDPDIE